MIDGPPRYWYSRLALERGLAFIYLIGFIVAANQFVPLLGSHGLESAAEFIAEVPFRASPSLFYLAHGDSTFTIAAWAGIAVAGVTLAGVPQRLGTPWAAAAWGLLWLLYLSFVNVGGTFYAFGWETLLLEAGFVAIFAGGRSTEPNTIVRWLFRWIVFRLMFGAGLIKLRGDPCWRDLTCLDYYFETQPIPNALSWYFHWLPPSVHHAGVVFNHIAEVIVPFGVFAPQPVASICGLVIVLFQATLIVSGNLSWLNWLTIVLAFSAIDDRWLRWLPAAPPPLRPDGRTRRLIVAAFAAVVVALSVAPVLNLLSPAQVMNTSFEPLHLVNTYGAFGSITRERFEIVIEGTADETLSPATVWREYAFKGKPGNVGQRPRQVAPYHLRLDWLMWFAAMGSPEEYPWFGGLLQRLLEGDRATVELLDGNPFPAGPPRFVRARYYRYTFTTPDEHARTGAWWRRELVGEYYPAVRLAKPIGR